MINPDGDNAFPVVSLQDDGIYEKNMNYTVKFMKMSSGKIGMHFYDMWFKGYTWRVFSGIDELIGRFQLPEDHLEHLKQFIARKPKKRGKISKKA